MTTETVYRGHYGELQRRNPEPITLSRGAAILDAAISRGRVDAPYCEVDHKHRGTALNWDIYDAAPGRVLVQRRHTTCTRWGSSPTKQYLILSRDRRSKITVTSADAYKAVIVKLAKTAPRLGAIIAHCEGRKRLKLSRP